MINENKNHHKTCSHKTNKTKLKEKQTPQLKMYKHRTISHSSFACHGEADLILLYFAIHVFFNLLGSAF